MLRQNKTPASPDQTIPMIRFFLIPLLSFLSSICLCFGDQSIPDLIDAHPPGAFLLRTKTKRIVRVGNATVGKLAMDFACETGKNGKIRTFGTWHEKPPVPFTEISEKEFHVIFENIAASLLQRYGAATPFDVPNFEDANQRTSRFMAWRNKKSILILQLVKNSGRGMITILHQPISDYERNLAGDFGAYMRPRLERFAGKLPDAWPAVGQAGASAGSSPGAEKKGEEKPPSRPGKETPAAPAPAKSPPEPQPGSRPESGDHSGTWPIIAAILAAAAWAGWLVRRKFSGNSRKTE